MKKLIITLSVAALLGLLQSAYFSLSAAIITSVVFSYILLAAIFTGYLVYLLFSRTKDIVLAAVGSVVIGAVMYNVSALLFDQQHVLQLLEPLMTLGAATGVLCLLVQVLAENSKVGVIRQENS